jgi:hypothetical protein
MIPGLYAAKHILSPHELARFWQEMNAGGSVGKIPVNELS